MGVVEASVETSDPGMVVNVADDLPSTRYEVSLQAECTPYIRIVLGPGVLYRIKMTALGILISFGMTSSSVLRPDSPI